MIKKNKIQILTSYSHFGINQINNPLTSVKFFLISKHIIMRFLVIYI